MIVIVCIDDNYGMMFNRRRQSKDQVLRKEILHLVGSQRLWMNAYTNKQFSNAHHPSIIIDENFLEKAEKGDYCFVEDKDLSDYTEKIEQIILFKWNRSYPADAFLSLNIDEWTLIQSKDFVGHSHEKITKETYKK